MKIEQIPLLKLNASQNRAYGGEGDIKILSEDIKKNGLINPITVKQTDSGIRYEVVAGRRRLAAVTMLGWNEISCRILEGDETERAEEIAGAENINRLPMHPLDEAVMFKRLLESGESAEELAKRFDIPSSAIWQRIQLIDLTDGVKELFRNGQISLHAAAMLKSLDEAQQFAFFDKFQKTHGISIWDVKGFISKVQHDKLFPCIVITGKCANCTKRTFYNDKALFPELRDADDLCLDHECYTDKWQGLLSDKIKRITAESRIHAEANIIVSDDDDLSKIFGKKFTIGKTEYAVVKSTHDNRPDDKPGKTSKPCFVIGIESQYDDDDNKTGQNITCVPMFWKEPEKKKDAAKGKKESEFEPIVNLLDLPADETSRALEAFEARVPKDNPWKSNYQASDINRTVRKKVLARLLEIKAKQPDDEKDIDQFLSRFFERTDKGTAKLFTGSDSLKEIRKLSWPKLFVLMTATQMNEWNLPDIKELPGAKSNKVLVWIGISVNQLREMYKEEIKALAPKTKPPAKKPEESKLVADAELKGKNPATKKPEVKPGKTGTSKK